MKTLSRRLSGTNPFRMLFSCRGFLFGPFSPERGIAGLFYIAAMLLCLLSPIPAMAQDSRGIIVTTERTALVIGNNAYQTAPLKNPVNDADDMSRVLRTLGFKVTLLKNVDRRAMEDSIRSFGRQLNHDRLHHRHDRIVHAAHVHRALANPERLALARPASDDLFQRA